MLPPLPTPADVLYFWRHAGQDRWWKKDDAFDTVVQTRFRFLWEAARGGKLASWQATDDGALALTITLDQFPRNMFRNDPKMFSTDAMALQVAMRAIDETRDVRMDRVLRQFVYLPFMHSEKLADQERCVALYREFGDAYNLKFAEEHRDIIKRFGRFPHRNAVLGRTTTPEEQAFLEAGGFAG